MSCAGTSPLPRSPYSCIECRKSKRKCDRIDPECTLCTKKNIQCYYPRGRKRRELPGQFGGISPTSSSNVESPESSFAQRPAPGTATTSAHSTLLAERFMDPELFNFVQLELPKLSLERFITPEVERLVGDVKDIHATGMFFFETVHTWMPIVCKRGFSELLVKRMMHERAQFYLLVLSMKLCSSRETETRSHLYEVVKQYYTTLERSGILSLMVLQAGVLITLYEMGHGIYPEAFLSVAQCARYGVALGVDTTIASGEITARKWPDLEEARRVWWSILVLDRFTNLSDPGRHLVTADPELTSYLPIDDEEWDLSTSGPDKAFTLRSAISLRLGRFARFAQAAHLLSQVLHQVTDKTSDTTQIRRTIFSLVNVSRMEADMRQLEFCTQMAVCYSGILLLDDPASYCSTTSESSSTAISDETASILESASKMTLRFSDGFVSKVSDLISPFLPFLIYKVTSLRLKMGSRHGSAPIDRQNTEEMRLALKYLSSRWFAADIYMTLLNRLEMLLITQQH